MRHEKKFVCVCNGEEKTPTDDKDDRITSNWSLDHPSPSYLLCFAVGEIFLYIFYILLFFF